MRISIVVIATSLLITWRATCQPTILSIAGQSDEQMTLLEYWIPLPELSIKMNTIAEDYDNWKSMTKTEVVLVLPTPEGTDQMIKSRDWPFKVIFDPDRTLYKQLTDVPFAVPASYLIDRGGDIHRISVRVPIIEREESKVGMREDNPMTIPRRENPPKLATHTADLSGYYEQLSSYLNP